MNALFAFEAKHLLLGFIHTRCRGVPAAFRQSSVVRGLQGIAHAPDAHVVEVQAVAVACLQGVDGKMHLRDAGKESVVVMAGLRRGLATSP